MNKITNTIYNLEEASKYSQISLQGEGTVYLSFRDLKEIISRAFPNQSMSGLKAIDYGCGAGRSTRYLKSIGIQEVHGFDISAEMIHQAKGFDPNGNYQLISSARLPVDEASYDMAFMSFVTVAIDQKSEITRVFTELSRILKKGGTILSLTLSETFWNPKRQWVSYEQDYPENYSPKSGQKSRVKINSVNLELTDSYWKEADIIDCANKAQLALGEIYHPHGKKEDGIDWKDEYTSPPYTIFSFQKL